MDFDALTKEDLQKISDCNEIDDRDVEQIRKFLKNFNDAICNRFRGRTITDDLAPELTLIMFKELTKFNQSPL